MPNYVMLNQPNKMEWLERPAAQAGNFLYQMALANHAARLRSEEALRTREAENEQFERKMNLQIGLAGLQEIPEGEAVPMGALKIENKYYKLPEIKSTPLIADGKIIGYAVSRGDKLEFMKASDNKSERLEQLEPLIINGRTVFRQRNLDTGEIKYNQIGPQNETRNEIKLDIGAKGMVKLSEEMSKALVTERDAVKGAVAGLRNIGEARSLIEEGVITGPGAEFLTTAGSLLSERLGIKLANDPVSNTQAYQAALGRQVGEVIKQFGSGTGLSDADRQYAEKIAGGKISVTKDSLIKILDINERAYKNTISDFNERADQAMKKPGADQLPFDLRIQVPEIGKTTGATNKTLSEEDIQFYMREWGKTRSEVINAYNKKFGKK